MLYLIGLGVWNEKDISLRGVEFCKQADSVYCELYTAHWGGDLEKLEKMIGKKIRKLKRKDVEEESGKLLEEAKKKDVVLLVPGDPLIATTHVHLILEAKKANIPVEIVHSSSIYTTVARTGLQIYKFGKTGTIITPRKGYDSKGFYEIIRDNLSKGMHTLLLLDRDMGTRKGLEILERIENRKRRKILKGRRIVLCSRLSSEHERIVYGRMEDLRGKDLPEPGVIIIPGKLHFLEKEFLETLG
ncbi:MAG: diphthine synthase [Candidatus Aenigmarchaeota archaeon]|nr:diphthine synthase [Candidatus Aenigmarchaeota archaeon]NIP41029.1 diphthine synthase [Candidatus Aenigmarchaeota archaeon]NIQ17431.1 diphthine synthase [Candidatus Aenigmarchaeota archaeon]NIS73625.1 diphthine synthase [Candidatus Aenigmarchaeota archaeon]